MKGCILEAKISFKFIEIVKIVGSNLVVEIFLKKRKHQKNGALKQKIEAPLYTLYWS